MAEDKVKQLVSDIESVTPADFEPDKLPEPLKHAKHPYGAKLETDTGTVLFMVTSHNSALLLNEGDPIKVQINENTLTPCKLKYSIRKSLKGGYRG